MSIPIRELDKNPTIEERESLIIHPLLQQALNELYVKYGNPDENNTPIDPELLVDEPKIRLEPVDSDIREVDEESDSTDHVDLDGLDRDSSDSDYLFRSNDLITRNVDFIPLWD